MFSEQSIKTEEDSYVIWMLFENYNHCPSSTSKPPIHRVSSILPNYILLYSGVLLLKLRGSESYWLQPHRVH